MPSRRSFPPLELLYQAQEGSELSAVLEFAGATADRGSQAGCARMLCSVHVISGGLRPASLLHCAQTFATARLMPLISQPSS
jgi:hypothetical protein